METRHFTSKLGLQVFGIGLIASIVSLSGATEPSSKRNRQYIVCFAQLENFASENAKHKSLRGSYGKNIKDVGYRNLVCPVSKKPYVYTVDATGQSYTIYCPGHAHAEDGVREGHPKYSSKRGPDIGKK